MSSSVTSAREGRAADIVRRRVRGRRTELRLSQKALAARLGISHQQYQKYEGGADRLSAAMLVRIARQLDCRVSALIGEPVSGRPPDPRLEAEAAELLQLYARLPTVRMRRSLIALLAEFAIAQA